MKQAVHPYHRCCRIVPSYAKPKGGIRISRANTAHRYHCHNKIVTCKYKKLFTSRDPPGSRLKAFCTHTSSKDVFYTYTNYKFVHSCGINVTDTYRKVIDTKGILTFGILGLIGWRIQIFSR